MKKNVIIFIFIGFHFLLEAQNAINFVVTPETNHCKNGCIDLQINGGYSPYSVIWYDNMGNSLGGSRGLDGNDGLEDLCNIEAGNYKVEIYDDLCGHISTTITVNRIQESNLNLSAEITPPIYYTCCDGKIDITINSSQPPFNVKWYKYNYSQSSWDNVANYQGVGYEGGDYLNTCLGRYKVIVDDNLCGEVEKVFEVNPKDEIKVLAKNIKNVSNCSAPEVKPWVGYYNSSNDGSITIELSKPLSYTAIWSNGQTGSTISNLSPGTYTVSVSIGGGCAQLIKSFNICCCSGFDPNNDGNNYIPYCNSNGNVPKLSIDDYNITPPISTNKNGAITIKTSGGLTGQSQYIWSGPNNFTASTKDISNLDYGIYCVTVTDGCSAVNSCYELVDCSKKSISINGNVTATCLGYSYGSISINVSGAKAPLKYLWNNGNTSTFIDLLNVGSYCVSISDANGCKATNCFAVGTKDPQRVECKLYCNNYKIKEFLPYKEKFNETDCRYTDKYCSDDVLVSLKSNFVGLKTINDNPSESCAIDLYCYNNKYYKTEFGRRCNECIFKITDDSTIIINCDITYCYFDQYQYKSNQSYLLSINTEYKSVTSVAAGNDEYPRGFQYWNFCSLNNSGDPLLFYYEVINKKGDNKYNDGDCKDVYELGKYYQGSIGKCGLPQKTNDKNSDNNILLYEDTNKKLLPLPKLHDPKIDTNIHFIEIVEGISFDYFKIKFYSPTSGNGTINFINAENERLELHYNIKEGENSILFDHILDKIAKKYLKLKIHLVLPERYNILDEIEFNPIITNDKLLVYPNPSFDRVNIFINETEMFSKEDITIYNSIGQRFSDFDVEFTSNGVILDLTKFKNSTFFVKFYNKKLNKNYFSEPIIKQ